HRVASGRILSRCFFPAGRLEESIPEICRAPLGEGTAKNIGSLPLNFAAWHLPLAAISFPPMIGNLLQPELVELIRQRNFNQLREILCDFPGPDIAETLGDLSADDKAVLLRILPHDLPTEVIE